MSITAEAATQSSMVDDFATAPFHCMVSIEKDMLKHPRRVVREHLRWVAMELNKKARVNRLTLSLKVLWTFLSSRE